MIKCIHVLGLAALFLLTGTSLLAAPVTARLDRNNVVVGETVTLVLQTNDTNQSLDTDLSVLQVDFDVLDRRSETQMSFVNGRQTATVRLVITLEPKRAGDIIIPALQFAGASSAPLRIKVSAAPELAAGEPEPVFIEIVVQPEAGSYYVHSQVGLTVRIFYQANLTEAAINPPAPTQARVKLLDEVPYQAERNGVHYRVLERSYAIFPERSGTLTIPAMQLSGRLIERPSDRLWQPRVRGRRVHIQSEPLTLEIKPRPAYYTGDFWLPARRITLSQQISDSGKLQVGEPITRTIIIDAVGLEENMLEEPRWPDIPDSRIYPDQPQGISRDDGEWVLGHKEFRYAVVPEKAGELVLPEIRLDWWDTVANQQRTAIVPEYRVQVLPSELGLASNTSPMATVAAAETTVAGTAIGLRQNGRLFAWQSATAALSILWLLTLYFLYRRGSVIIDGADTNGSATPDEKAILKQFEQACQKDDAPAARRSLSQWVRNHAPDGMGSSIRDFAAASGDRSLQQVIDELDISGFASGTGGQWRGKSLSTAFKRWRKQTSDPRKNSMADKPDLYAGL